MRTLPECLPCLLNQIVAATRRAGAQPELQEKIIRKAMRDFSVCDMDLPPPLHAEFGNKLVREMTNTEDNYLQDKQQSNHVAAQFLPRLQKLLAESPTPFETAVRLAIAGNIIDFGICDDLDFGVMEETIEHALDAPLNTGIVAELEERMKQADKILYLGDNAGELFFDRLLIEQLPPGKVTFVVKSRPVLNDALYVDAEIAGITEIATVIENGTGIAGTWLPQTNERLRREFKEADLIISKGQGNFETLDGQEREIFFLLKVKCSAIASRIGEPLGTLLVKKSTSI